MIAKLAFLAPRLSLRKVLAAGAAIIALGAAWGFLRGPDLDYVPQMAERVVTLPDGHAIYVQKYEVTVAEWNRCHADGACELALRAPPGSETATMVWSSAPRKMASIRAVSTLRRLVGGRAAVTGIPCLVYASLFVGKPTPIEAHEL